MRISKPAIFKKHPKVFNSILYALMSPILVLAGLMLALLVVIDRVVFIKRLLVGPKEDYKKWFAWHPVKLSDEYDIDGIFPQDIWLWGEFVERSVYGSFLAGGDIQYRRFKRQDKT